MELSHSLTLNEEALLQIPEAQQPMFIFEWLRFLDKVLVAAQKSDIKGCQKKLVQQLTDLIEKSQGPPTRKLIASCLSTLFSVGDTFLLFDTVNKCNDILKNKDDSPSLVNTKLAAMCCVGSMYEKLGRMMGRSYEETVHILIKSLKSADSQTRIAIMQTLEKICSGMGSAIANVHKDIYKACRSCLTDRVMSVRCATAKCLLEMVKHATDMESLATLCFRALDGSNYEVRLCIAKLLGALVASTQHQPKGNTPMVSQPSNKNVKTTTLEEALGVLQSGFLKGGGGFLKGTGEIIKGTAGVNREVRVGVTHAYVEFIKIVGGPWLERNLSPVLNHILELVAKVAQPKVATSHVDAVYSRKCVSFILRSVLGKLLSEKAQTSALKEITLIVTKHLAVMDVSSDSKDYHQETAFSQHLLVCALQEMSSLILGLGTTANNVLSDKSCNLLETVMISLIHPSQAVRLASAWCLRCICVAVPSQCTPLIDRCIECIEMMKNSPEAISGYSYALAAVLGGVKLSCLGIPHTKGKVIFNTAEELLRSANQNSRLSLHRTQAGWLLIGAIITLGVPVVRKLMPRMLLLWRNSFPQSKEKLDSEKERGEAFTWQVTLEGRAGALSAMYSFAYHCPELLTPDHTRRLLVPISKAIEMMASIGSVLKTYGQNLKAPAAMVRLRLYETLSLLSSQCFEGTYRSNLLGLLVSELTLGENPANTTTSHVKTFCYSGESVLLGSGLQETDHRIIEDQLQTVNSVAGSGALEHDICCLYRALPEGETIPGPLPLGIAVVDASVVLFGSLFPKISNKHRLKILDCFADYIKHAKSARADAVTTNVFAALLCSLKNVNDVKGNIGQEDVKKAATTLILGTLGSNTASLRCAAGEALGRLAQAVGDARFTAELAQNSFDRLKSARDVTSRTGHSLALGCLHRYVGGMGSSQHLNTSVSILLALAQDPTSPVVQVWSLHALSLIADSGGPMFRGYVENALSLAIKLLLTVPQSFVDVHQCIGKVLSALITTVGPELQGNSRSISMARSSFLCACTMMQDHDDPSVQAEAIACLQQLHLFAPRHVNLSSLVPTLCRTLSSSHLLLRKAAVSCLRQLTQREAKEVCEHALILIEEKKDFNEDENTLVMTETGLPGMLFNMLNTETDSKLIKYTHDTLISMLNMLAADNLSPWLSLIKSVLTVASDASINEDTTSTGGTSHSSHLNIEDDEHDDADDDQSEFHTEEKAHVNIMPRWPTRVFAAECVRKIIAVCMSAVPGPNPHFDLALAKELVATKNKSDYLVLHLSELVRMAFMAATSDSDPLRLEGLHTLKDIIDRFSGIPEPEFPGHLLLEQYQAQVGAALRPAFSPDTASHVTAAACKVCSSWIGSGVARDLNDLRRVHQLLVSSLVKLSGPHRGNPIYNESLTTLETLAILKAWAEVYVVAMTNNGHSLVLNTSDTTNNNINNRTSQLNDNREDNNDDDDFGNFESPSNNLLSLVQPELKTLASHWLNVLKDYALLSLPPEFASQLPHEGGAFYTSDTMDSCRSYYSETWPAVLHATSLWLNNEGKYFDVNATERKASDTETFHLMFGICMEALCNTQILENTDIIVTSLKALYTLLDSVGARQILTANKSLPIELCNVIHRLILTKDSGCVQEIAMKVVKQIVQAVQEDLDALKKKKLRELAPANQEQLASEEIELLGEGGSNGTLKPGESIVFSLLEVCLCLVVRRLPALNPTPLVSPIFTKSLVQNEESGHVILATAINVMQMLPRLCSPHGAVSILPTLLYLLTGIIKETATKTAQDNSVLASKPSITAALHALKTLCGYHSSMPVQVKQQWNSLLQSALAKVIDLAKTVAGTNETKTDEVTMMLALAVFILHVPSEVIAAPNLQYPCINHFRQCVQSENIQVRIKCVQTLRTLFSHPDSSVSNGYIHALAPRVVQYLYATEKTSIDSELKLQFVLELIYTAENLVKLSQPKNRTQMLSILVPILIKFLADRTESSYVNKHLRSLHDQSIQILMKIGPLYPQEFKSLMSESPDLRLKLEAAIKSNNVTNQRKEVNRTATNVITTATPTIKLKTNFGNFN